MPDAISKPNTTEGSDVYQASNNSNPPVDWPLHGLVDDPIPPGSQSGFYVVHAVNEYFYFKIDPSTIPVDFDKTGDSGFGLAYFHATIPFILQQAAWIQGFVSGSPVTNIIKFWIYGLVMTRWLAFPADEITANWDGAKGHLTRDQFINLEIRIIYKNGGPGDIDPPIYS